MTEAELIRHYASVRDRLMNAPPPPVVQRRFVMRVPKSRRDPQTAWAAIVREVADAAGVNEKDLIENVRRSNRLSVVRFECYYRIKTEMTMPDGSAPSYPLIGRWMGGRDHTTIMHGVRRWAEMNGLAVPG